jgi:DNA-binding NarL/FixJ family response regulator
MRFMIAEDEAVIRERLKKMIARSGLDLELVGEASNGEEALAVQQEVAASGSTGSTADLTMLQRSNPFTMRMAAIVITTLPILVVYPFLQRFFMKGILLGSVKG